MMTMLSLERSRSSALAFDDAVAHARHVGQTALYSRVERLPFAPDAIAFLSASSAALGSGTLWEQPAARLLSWAPGWPGRCVRQDPVDSAKYLRRCELRSRLVRDDAAVFPTLGGFAFSELGDGSHLWSDFPSARLVVPQVLIQNDGDGTLLRVTVEVGPRSAPGDVEEQIGDLFQRARG